MNLKELDNFKLHDAIYFHDNLNPAIFAGDNMRNDVKEQLLIIAGDFIDHLGLNNIQVIDITISGSNAAYTYTKHSDIDLHILVNMQSLNDEMVYRELFHAKKTLYNDTHDIVVNGYEVELYIQDSNEPVISLGEYSILHDKWIKLPKKSRANLDQMATKLKFNKLRDLAMVALKHGDSNKIQSVIDKIKKYRKNGLHLHGEFGPENLAFKALRSKGIINKLYDKLNELHSERLSLPESKLLDKPEMTTFQLARKYGVSRQEIDKQLKIGIKVEMEHTSKFDVAKEIALDHLAEKPDYYSRLKRAELEENASGYIPSQKEKNDPRYKTALTVDIGPKTMQQNASRLGSKISRAGIPPLLRP
jgi:hypothetical protein